MKFKSLFSSGKRLPDQTNFELIAKIRVARMNSGWNAEQDCYEPTITNPSGINEEHYAKVLRALNNTMITKEPQKS